MPNFKFSGQHEVCSYTVKYCKIVIFVPFFERGSYKNQSIDMRFFRGKQEGVSNVHSKFQVSRTSGSLFWYCKILQNCNFLYLFELGYHKNQYNDMKLYMDKLTGMKNLHAKFQVSQSSESMFLYCKILQDSDFLYLFLSVAPTEIEALTWNFWGTN